MNTQTAKTTIKTLVSAIETRGIRGLIATATSLYAQDVCSRLHYGEFYKRTDRATLPLLSLDEAIYYNSTFAKEHMDRLTHALGNLGANVMFAQKLTVVDYGCGQGLATLVLLQYLQVQNCIANKVIAVHLIEPSLITLALARQFVKAMAKHTHIRVNITVHKKILNNYLRSPLKFKADETVLHLLSNIVDVDAVQDDLLALSKHINAEQGEHYVCAVSSYDKGFNQLRHGLTRFAVVHERFSVASYRFNSNRCVWQQRDARGQALYAKIA